MGLRRDCSKTGCTGPAVATLTYAYADRAVVLGPLATYAEPHTYDLCRAHAERLTAPRGWEVVRVGGEWSDPVGGTDDLLAVVDAVRERGPSSATWSSAAGDDRRAGTNVRPAGAAGAAGATESAGTGAAAEVTGPGEATARRRGHLRILRDI